MLGVQGRHPDHADGRDGGHDREHRISETCHGKAAPALTCPLDLVQRDVAENDRQEGHEEGEHKRRNRELVRPAGGAAYSWGAKPCWLGCRLSLLMVQYPL